MTTSITAGAKVDGGGSPRICIIGAGPCGLTTLKNVLAAGLRNLVCFDESDAIGGNWVFREDTSRMCVYESTHIISSKGLSAFEDFPMPAHYPDFPSRQQVLAYFESYADAFDLRPYVELDTRVTAVRQEVDTRWSVSMESPDGTREELFDYVMVCSGHHREPFIPTHLGHFTGQVLHSCAYRRADPFRDKDVLVVGAGNSACDIAADVSRVARRACISIRRPVYIIPKMIGGYAIDELGARYDYRFLPKTVGAMLCRWLLPLCIGPYEWYGLRRPSGTPFDSHPTLNSSLLEGLRHGRIQPRAGIDRFDGDEVRFEDGVVERFDAIIWATGFRTSFPFLPTSVVDWDATQRPPLYLKMMHGSLPSIFFIGLFQPFGCIWNLADHQARIAVMQITGRLDRPRDIEKRIAREMSSPHWRYHNSPRHALEVHGHDFRRELMRELNRVPAQPPRKRFAFRDIIDRAKAKGEKPADLPVQAPTKYGHQPEDRRTGLATARKLDQLFKRERADALSRRESAGLLPGLQRASLAEKRLLPRFLWRWGASKSRPRSG